MASYVPNTEVRLLSGVPLDNTYSDVLKFADKAAQSAYFISKSVKQYTNFTYQRPNSSVDAVRPAASVTVPEVADNLYTCNYLMFRNTNFGDKWFYAFVKNVEFLSESSTRVTYELDHYQTWQFDIAVQPSFVEREHTLNDAIFANLEPEPVDPGMMVCTGVYNDYADYASENMVFVGLAGPPDGKSISAATPINGRVYSGVSVKEFRVSDGSAIASLLSEYADQGTLDRVLFIINSPFHWNSSSGGTVYPDTVQMAGSVGAYTPVNKKLLAYPFQFLEMIAPNGSTQTLYYEKFASASSSVPSVGFWHQFVCTPTPVLICAPAQYDIQSPYGSYSDGSCNASYAFSINEFPMGAWMGNVFANWLAQNAAKNAMTTIKGTAKVGIGALAMAGAPATAGISGVVGAGLMASGAADLAGQTTRDYDMREHSMEPMGTALDGSANYALGRVGIEARRYQIRPDRARRIDTFFNMFGYATNEVKMPNITGRLTYNYVKTKDVVINGSIPVDSMAVIKRMFNNGVRFWHNPAAVGNYSYNNAIVGGEN